MGQGSSSKEERGKGGKALSNEAPQTGSVGFMDGLKYNMDPAVESVKALYNKFPAAAASKETEAAADVPANSPAEAAAEGEAVRKPNKDGESKGKEGKGKKGTAKGKEGKWGKEGKGKDAKGKDGKGKNILKGAVKGSGPTAGGSGYRLNVKNLGGTTEEELRKLFEPFGEVSMVEIKKNENGESRGLGFVVLPGEKEGQAAVSEMNLKEVNGAKLNVAAAERRVAADDEEEAKGKGKGKGKGRYGVYAAQALYAQQWAAYSQMMYMQQYAAMQQHSLWASRGKEYEGSLKSVSSRNGYGFIVCRETYELFGGRDVYVDESLLPERAVRGSRLFFTVNGNEKGHPKAVTCRLAPQL